MRKFLTASAIVLITFSANINAFWGGNNSNDPWDDNDWPVWSPMYWMEEMSDEFDNNSWSGGNGYGYQPYGYAPSMPQYGPHSTPYSGQAPYPQYAPGYPAPGYRAPTYPAPSSTAK